MIKLYRLEKRRLQRLKSYSAIVTHSEHMRQEYIRSGLEPQRVFRFAYEVARREGSGQYGSLVQIATCKSSKAPKNILFLGRMETLKGGTTLIAAGKLLPRLIRQPVRITFGGDGRQFETWRRLAAKAELSTVDLSFSFPGWLNSDEIAEQFNQTDVLAMPSLWPEPFGRVGTQAGLHGIPVAAFDVGGIPDWLSHGVNGCLAPGDPPTHTGLANAIRDCLELGREAGFAKRAQVLSERFSAEAHLEHLTRLFHQVSARREKTSAR